MKAPTIKTNSCLRNTVYVYQSNPMLTRVGNVMSVINGAEAKQTTESCAPQWRSARGSGDVTQPVARAPTSSVTRCVYRLMFLGGRAVMRPSWEGRGQSIRMVLSYTAEIKKEGRDQVVWGKYLSHNNQILWFQLKISLNTVYVLIIKINHRTLSPTWKKKNCELYELQIIFHITSE